METKRPNHLRLVTDDPPPPKPPRYRRGVEFTAEQRARLREALRGLRARYGTYVRLAQAMGIAPGTISTVLSGRGGSYMMAARAAHLAGVPVETILHGVPMSADKCPTCGQKLPEKKTT